MRTREPVSRKNDRAILALGIVSIEFEKQKGMLAIWRVALINGESFTVETPGLGTGVNGDPDRGREAEGSASEICSVRNGDFCAIGAKVIVLKNLRRTVSELMVDVHLISRELADYHVARMDQVELWRRFSMYTGMELSAEGRNQQSGSDFYPVFGFATATARLSAFNPVPELPTEQRNGQESARAGNKKPGPMVVRALSASH